MLTHNHFRTHDVLPVDLDDVHAGHMAGFDHGRAVGRREASVDLARAWLHNLANDYEALAISNARSRHGNAWAEGLMLQARGGDQ